MQLYDKYYIPYFGCCQLLFVLENLWMGKFSFEPRLNRGGFAKIFFLSIIVLGLKKSLLEMKGD